MENQDEVMLPSTTTPQEIAQLLKEKLKAEVQKGRNDEKHKEITTRVVENPFVYVGPLWTFREVICVCFGIVLVPLRILAIFLLSCLAWSFLKLSISFGYDSNVPMKGWRRAIQIPVAYLTRICLFVMGFYWVETVGKPAKLSQAKIIVCAPHSTAVDTLYVIYAFNLPSAISKVENLKLPLSGTAFRAMEALTVDRTSRLNKNLALDALTKRAQETTRQVMIFPEGTCTNRKALINFKRGAFVSGQPVQAVCLEWPWTGFDLSWTAAGPSLTFLPVHVPTEEEKVNHQLFANNVRQEMAHVLNIPTTSHSYEDMYLAKEARKLKVHGDKVPFELYEISSLYKINLDDAKALLQRYSTIYKNEELIDGLGLAKVLGIPYSRPVKDLFELLKDEEDADGIDFKRLLIGVASISKALNTTDLDASIDLVWKTISKGQATLTEAELFERLSRVFSGFELKNAKGLLKKAEVGKGESVSFETFKDFLRERPELLFVAIDTVAIRASGRRLSVLTKETNKSLNVAVKAE